MGHRSLMASTCGAVLLAALADPARAQSQAPAADAPVTTQPGATQPGATTADSGAGVQTITVTAQRRSENIQNVPVTIQAFTDKEIKDLGVKSTADIGEFTPNVDIALPGGRGNQPIITIRGIGLNDASTNNSGPNGVYLDEVYLSSPSSQTFQTYDLERVEVLKGPQGTLYGRNASGGALNLVTVKPTDYYTGDFHAEYSSYNTYQIEGGVGGPIVKDLDGRVAFVVNQSQGYMKNLLDDAHENGADDFALRGQLLWKPRDDLKVLFNVHGARLDARPDEYRHLGTQDPNTGATCSVAAVNAGGCVDLFGYGTPKGFFDGAFNRREDHVVNDVGTSLRVDWTPGAITFTSISAFNHNDNFNPEDTDASPNRLVEIDSHARADTVTQEFRASRTTDRYNWVAGFYFLHEDLKQNQPVSVLADGDKFFGAGAFDGVAFQAFDQSDQLTDAYAVYGQGTYDLTSKLSFTLGGRLTREDRSFHYDGKIAYQEGGAGNSGPIMQLALVNKSLEDDNFSYRVGLNYKFLPHILGYVSVATGFKSGVFNGGFLSTDPAEINRQLDPVKPETVTAYEVGVKSELFDRRLVLNVAGFYNDYTNEQLFELASPPPGSASGLPVSVLGNAQSAHTEGFDIQLQARPVRALSLGVNVGLLNTELDKAVSQVASSTENYSGNQLPLAPHVSLALFLDYKHPVPGGVLDLQANANYRSHQFFDIANDPYLTQGAYWIGNLRLAYQPDRSNWEFAVFARNVANEHYYIDKFNLIDPFGLVQGIVGLPRMIGAEVNYKF